MGNRSCAGCEHLYFQDVRYSNYTMTETVVHCALDRNPNLKGEEVEVPYDWRHDLRNGIYDRWAFTCNSMCERYSPLRQGCTPATFDLYREATAADQTAGFSLAARRAITKHSGR